MDFFCHKIKINKVYAVADVLFTNIATTLLLLHIKFVAKNSMRKTITFSKSATRDYAKDLRKAVSGLLKMLFTSAGAAAGAVDSSYTLNGIDDISEEEMLAIYTHKEAIDNLDIPQALQGCAIRTIIPCPQAVGVRLKYRPLNGERSFAGSSIEVIKFGCEQELNSSNLLLAMPATKLDGTFCGCKALHTIYPINIKNAERISEDTFSECSALKEVRLYGLNTSVRFSHSPLISYRSLMYTVMHSNKNGIEIELHPTTYKYMINMLSAPTSIGGTKNEWDTLQRSAEEKNIVFTTTEIIIFVYDAVLYMNCVSTLENEFVISEKNASINKDCLILIN